MPRISVITVVKNGERYLAEALHSILGQSLAPHEIIVVDGQSTDNTVAIARSTPGVRIIAQTNHGLANARNLGIAAATGDWIAFLDHDDVWVADKLQVQTQHMLDHPHVQYTTTLMRFIREPGAIVHAELDQATLDTPRPGSTPSALMARREVFDRVGLFDPRYRIGCDADWLTRARDDQVPTAVVPHVLLYKRLHRTNLSVQGLVNRQEMFHIAKASIDRRRRALDQ